MMKTKRNFDRPSMISTVEVTVPGRKFRTNGNTINISYTGIGIYVQDSLTVGEEIIIMITYTEGVEFPAFESVYGTVKWCKKVGEWFAVGIRFNQVDSSEHAMLHSFLKMTEQYK